MYILDDESKHSTTLMEYDNFMEEATKSEPDDFRQTEEMMVVNEYLNIIDESVAAHEVQDNERPGTSSHGSSARSTASKGSSDTNLVGI